MRVEHKKSQAGPSLASKAGDKYYYRTEVTNTQDVPVRIVWFESYLMLDGEYWHGVNITNKVLREEMFVKWYSDGETKPVGGWLRPGETVVCDPNWHFACADEFQKVKWVFLAVDSKGKSYFFEALVEPDCVQFHKEQKSDL